MIRELKNKIAHYEALLRHDGTNTSLPTSKTPIEKKKRIPNTREKSDRPKGGQPGHEKHELEKPDETEVTQTIEHDSTEAGYGSTLQTLALTLTNNVNAAMNKNAMFLAGITSGELHPCEGYIAKLQKRAAKGLIQFYQ